MAKNGIHKYTVQESGNLGIGQGGSAFLNLAADTVVPPTGQVIIAIQVISNTTFSALVAEDTSFCPGGGTRGGGSGTDPSNPNTTNGSVITLGGSGTQIPAGTMLYGRWTSASVQTNGETIMCYFG